MTLHLSPEQIAALKSTLDWWARHGVEPLPEATPGPRSSAPRASAPSPNPAQPTASAAAARAAGFRQPNPEDDGLALAQSAGDLEALRAALERFEGCNLKNTARNLVFSRGNPKARLMIMGEAPGREEDEAALPFVGEAGQLLDKMLAAIGLAEDDVYITTIVPWRPPGNRKPTEGEVEACLPFAQRHIALKNPDLLVFAGGLSAQSLLKSKTGIMSLRGRWHDYAIDGKTIAALPMIHPSFLLRRPQEKAKAWQDLLALKTRLAAL
ncbi:uracil-DNA glycosylase [Woodsholea maritima]|uniref:uracil-DNA glycosylase n=1 Tax=Woodsholea maritima TaxID=240237 RepID=UPI00035E4D41|nr:uracil-DNA glycosylase [Woodsholea maritima]